MNEANLKAKVKEFWNLGSCGTSHTQHAKFSPQYFNQIEQVRYEMEPEIFAFAQFTRYRLKKVLEVGVGAGTDFLQWARAGAKAYGVDLTEEAIGNTRERLAQEGLEAQELKVGDCENLPYPDDCFDLVYSWGVIHHTPDTEKAFREIVRVCNPGGRCKIMVYHRHSLHVYYTWFRRAFLGLRPWKSLAWCLAHHVESPGTKAYLPREIRRILQEQPVADLRIEPRFCIHDYSSNYKLMRMLKFAAGYLLGRDRVGWFLLIEFTKVS